MIDYTKAQIDAVRTLDRNLQIIACAGSGKTQVISARIVEILKKKKGINPGNIVAFTFTEKAAGELKDRIHSLCRQELGSDYGLDLPPKNCTSYNLVPGPEASKKGEGR